MALLTRLRIQNYRCFADLELWPSDLTLLIGKNGSGKSTLFDVLAALGDLIVDAARPADCMLIEVDGGPDAIFELDVELGGDLLRYHLELTDPTHWRVHRESVTVVASAGPPAYDMTDGAVQVDGERLAVRLRTDGSPMATLDLADDHPVQRLRNWFFGVWLLRLAPQIMDAETAEEEATLDHDGENFASWLLRFDARDLARLSASARIAIPDLEALAFEKVGRSHVLVARFSGDRVFDFDDLSDGQRVLIVLHAALVLSGSTLLLLDEPDAHVTSTELRPLIELIRNRVEAGGVQAMIASHHPQVIDLLSTDHVLELIKEGHAATAGPLEFDLTTGLSPSKYLLFRE